MEGVKKGIYSIIGAYMLSLDPGPSSSPRELLRLLLKLKPAQDIIFEALSQLTPLITDWVLKEKYSIGPYTGESRRFRPKQDLPPFRPNNVLKASQEANNLMRNFHQFRSKMETVQELIHNFPRLEVETNPEVYSFSEDKTENELVGLLTSMSNYVPGSALDIRDISHDSWHYHTELEHMIATERERMQQIVDRYENTYIYKLLWIKEKSGKKILQLENKISGILEKYRLDLDRISMNVEDIRSETLEKEESEMALVADCEMEDISNLPSALKTIKHLENKQKSLEKEILKLQKSIRNHMSNIFVVKELNKDLKGINNQFKKNQDFLVSLLQYFVDNSNIIDQDKEKIKKKLDQNKLEKVHQNVQDGKVSVRESKEYVINKFFEFRDRVSERAVSLKDRTAALSLFKIIEDVQIENIIEESEKVTAKKMKTMEMEIKKNPNKISKRPGVSIEKTVPFRYHKGINTEQSVQRKETNPDTKKPKRNITISHTNNLKINRIRKTLNVARLGHVFVFTREMCHIPITSALDVQYVSIINIPPFKPKLESFSIQNLNIPPRISSLQELKTRLISSINKHISIKSSYSLDSLLKLEINGLQVQELMIDSLKGNLLRGNPEEKERNLSVHKEKPVQVTPEKPVQVTPEKPVQITPEKPKIQEKLNQSVEESANQVQNESETNIKGHIESDNNHSPAKVVKTRVKVLSNNPEKTKSHRMGIPKRILPQNLLMVNKNTISGAAKRLHSKTPVSNRVVETLHNPYLSNPDLYNSKKFSKTVMNNWKRIIKALVAKKHRYTGSYAYERDIQNKWYGISKNLKLIIGKRKVVSEANEMSIFEDQWTYNPIKHNISFYNPKRKLQETLRKNKNLSMKNSVKLPLIL